MTDLLDPPDLLDELGDSEFHCDECGRDFKTQAGLTSHQNNSKDHSTYANPRETERAPKLKAVGGGKTPGLEARLQASIATIGAGVHMLGDAHCGGIVVDNAPMMARTAAELAAENETVRKAFEMIAGGGAWGAFLFSWVGVVLAILAHHHMVPDAVVPPTVTRPRPAANTNGHAPTGGPVPTVNEDGSMTFMGMTLSAEQIAGMSASMGLDPRLFGPSEAGAAA